MRRWVLAPAALIAGMLGGCAADGSFGTETSSVTGTQPGQKADPACAALFTRVDELRKDGVQDKIEKAAGKKYKMTTADLTKADQLNKANAEYQAKCTVQPVQAAAPAAQATAAQ